MKKILKNLASQKLTVVLLFMGMGLVVIGTLAQRHVGIFVVKKDYFDTFFIWQDSMPIFPGGYLIGLLLALNLAAAHITTFKYTVKKLGVIFIHAGVFMLMTGMLITSIFQTESNMEIDEGAETSFSVNQRDAELVVIDHSNKEYDDVVSMPQSLLAKGKIFKEKDLPLSLKILDYMPNANLAYQKKGEKNKIVTKGTGVGLFYIKAALVKKDNEVNAVTVIAEVFAEGKSLGVWLFSNLLKEKQFILYNNRKYEIGVRARRYYYPFSIRLEDFAHDKYEGTNIPKNFSSQITLIDPAAGEKRPVLIKMNEPLRYAGKTFFQHQFKNNNTTSILQVVENPGWTIPYISCTIISLGMLIHFLGMLSKHIKSVSNSRKTEEYTQVKMTIPIIFLVLTVLYLFSTFVPKWPNKVYDYSKFAKIPILSGGRKKPLDTIARNVLLLINGKQDVKTKNGKIPASVWMMDVLFYSKAADEYKIFEINTSQILSMLKNEKSRDWLSFNELIIHSDEIMKQARLASKIDKQKQTLFQKEITRLYEKMIIYQRLKYSLSFEATEDFQKEIEMYKHLVPLGRKAYNAFRKKEKFDQPTFDRILSFIDRYKQLSESGYFRIIPPEKKDGKWRNSGEVLTQHFNKSPIPETLMVLAEMSKEYRLSKISDNPKEHIENFNNLLGKYNTVLPKEMKPMVNKVGWEFLFNTVQPFYFAMIVYVLAFMLGIFSLIKMSESLKLSALYMVTLAFVVHTIGLGLRTYIQGYAPVTNLYSSAVFAGWSAVFFALIVRMIQKNIFGILSAAVIGFVTLIVAHHLAAGEDTMEMMRAVLDSNFWLTTHVLSITMGYGAMFFAGTVAIFYIFMNIYSSKMDPKMEKTFAKLVYGIICTAMLFSFVGTILGGIWADQSWGRFWGWDPKENGALLIVIWNAIILHARWSGMIRIRGLMIFAVFGNIITSLSWFGVNMLGIGLHSYGFTENKQLVYLLAFVASQLLIMLLATIPQRKKN